VTGYTSGRTRSGGTDRTYFSPGATEYVTEARQIPSAHRDQPSHNPAYQRPSPWSTSTGRGSSKCRTSASSATAATVGAE